MIKGTTWILFIVLNLLFISLSTRVFVTMSLKALKDDWAKYRCNPLAIPFSDDPSADFVYCVQKIQGSSMKYLMQPFNSLLGGLGNIANFSDVNILNIREMISYMRSQTSFIIKSVFSVIIAIVVEFQRITIQTKDLMMKIVGIVTVVMNLVDGSIKTGQSTWNGPPGKMVRSLTKSTCFHPSTLIKLSNGSVCEMKNLHLGDVLETGSKVMAVMKLSNYGNDVYYAFNRRGIDGGDVYVTGNHFVKSAGGGYIHAKDHPDAVPMPDKEIDELSCLITDDHRIQIGEMTFWDWEDDDLYSNV